MSKKGEVKREGVCFFWIDEKQTTKQERARINSKTYLQSWSWCLLSWCADAADFKNKVVEPRNWPEESQFHDLLLLITLLFFDCSNDQEIINTVLESQECQKLVFWLECWWGVTISRPLFAPDNSVILRLQWSNYESWCQETGGGRLVGVRSHNFTTRPCS